MSYTTLMIIFIAIFLRYCICSILSGKDSCGVYISGEILDNLTTCDGVKDTIVNADNFKIIASDNGDGSKILQGYFDVTQDVVEGDMLQIEAWKVTDLGQKEFEMTISWDICSNIKNKDTPWHFILESMGITHCPIKANKYECRDLNMDLNSFQGKLDEEMCGTHYIYMKIMNGLAKKACLMVHIDIDEKQKDDC